MSRCQACDKQATHHSKHGALRARCCSERCGRELFAGLTSTGAGSVHVAAASPLGRAIAQRMQCTSDYIIPESVAAQLVGALQRIGPKRAAADADLPASAQADAPTSIDWIADLPPEIWTTIVQRLQRADLRAFAATSSDSAAIARTDIVQAEKYRQNRSPYDAALAYVSSNMTKEQRRIIRMAYPNVVELAFARLVVFDTEQLNRLDLEPELYRRLLIKFRTKADRDGDKLYTNPIQVPILPRTVILERRHVKSLAIVPAMAAAFVKYAEQYDFGGATDRLKEYVRTYLRVFVPIATTDNIPGNLEMPNTPCFFSYPYLFNRHILHPFALNSLNKLFAFGVDPKRSDAGFWLADMLSRTRRYYVIDHQLDDIVANTDSFSFADLRADGQMSLLYMAKKVWKTHIATGQNFLFHKILTRFLEARNLIGAELRAPVITNSSDGNTILHLLCHTDINPLVTDTIKDALDYTRTADGIANPPLLVRNAFGETPVETMIAYVAKMKYDDIKRIVDDRLKYIISWIGMNGHPFAQSTVRNKPILAIIPVEFQYEIILDLGASIPTIAWDNADVKQYLLYTVIQFYNGILTIDQVAPIVEYIFQSFAFLERSPVVVEPTRPLLTPRLDADHPLRRWFD